MQNACVWNDCLRAVLETLSPRDERVTAQALGIGDKERIYLNFSPAGTQPTDVILAMTAIQGLINRSGPFILFDSTAYPGTWGGTPRVLADYVARRLECAMEKRSGESAEENLRLLLRLTAGALRGATVYDPANVHNYALAANIAAITFTVPLSRRLFVMLQEENALEEVYTLTASSGSESEIYGFIAQELVPYLDTTCFYNFATKGDVANGDCLPGTDYAFYRKGILYDIDKGENYTRLMRLAGPNALEFGWNYCGEAKSSCFGIGQFASVQGTTNLSFFAAMPSELKRPWKENCKPSVDTPARKLYLAFVSNEGDTGGVLTTQFKGAWNSPNRGRFYQNWAINPNAARLFPALLEFYVSTKTDKDHFICAPSGAAYVHGDLMSPEALGRFIDFTADILSKDCSLREAGVWACSDMAVQYRLLRELDLDMVVPKPEGLFPYGGYCLDPQSGKPMVYEGNLHYWHASEEYRKEGYPSLRDKVMKAYEYHKDNLPQYIVAYGNEGHCNDDIARLAQELKDEDIEIIDLCTMAHLAARSDTAFVAPTGISTQDSPYPVFSREMLLDASLWHVDNDEWHEGIKGEAQAQDGLALTIARDATEADEGWVSFALENVRLPQETTRMGFRIANPENANRVFVRLYGEFADAEVFWMHLTPSYDWDEDTGGTGEWLLHDKICSAARAKKPVKINITAIGEPGKRVYIRDLYFR